MFRIGILNTISIIKRKNLEWFPRMRAMSLDASGKAEEDNELSNIKLRLEFTNNLVANLSKQLDELNERVIFS
jgi:hypothetical protein